MNIAEKYKSLFNGYKNESLYRKNIIQNINKTNYNNLKSVCRKIEYGLSNYDLIRIAEAYKTASQDLKDKIEYILTDINFHYECGELLSGHADKIIRENKQEILKTLRTDIVGIFEKQLNQNRNAFEININSELLKEYSNEELEYLKEISIIESSNKDTYKLSQQYLDNYLKEKWKELEDVSFIENDIKEQVLDEDYWDFSKGTVTNEDIWRYFDKNYSKGVYYLFGSEEETNKIDNEEEVDVL